MKEKLFLEYHHVLSWMTGSLFLECQP
jgi:hypothetical protein